MVNFLLYNFRKHERKCFGGLVGTGWLYFAKRNRSWYDEEKAGIPIEFAEIRSWADKVRRKIANVIVGKEEVIDRLLIALAANGHILLEDVPGTGKTLLAKTLAKSLDCRFGRVQFTPDLLPSDLSGIHYFNQKTS